MIFTDMHAPFVHADTLSGVRAQAPVYTGVRTTERTPMRGAFVRRPGVEWGL